MFSFGRNAWEDAANQPLIQSRTEIQGSTAPGLQAGEWPVGGVHTPHRGCCCPGSQPCSSYTATLSDKHKHSQEKHFMWSGILALEGFCAEELLPALSFPWWPGVYLSLTCVWTRANRREAVLNCGCSRGEPRTFTRRAEDRSHFVHRSAMRTLPGWQRRTATTRGKAKEFKFNPKVWLYCRESNMCASNLDVLAGTMLVLLCPLRSGWEWKSLSQFMHSLWMQVEQRAWTAEIPQMLQVSAEEEDDKLEQPTQHL